MIITRGFINKTEITRGYGVGISELFEGGSHITIILNLGSELNGI